MTGLQYQNLISQLLSEYNTTWIDLKSSFDYVWEAAKDFSKETRAHSVTQSITTVALTAGYNLLPSFLEILTKDDHEEYVVQYYDGTNTNWISLESYSDYLQNGNTSGTPSNFCVTDATAPAAITGTADSTLSPVAGQTALVDASADFTLVTIGDEVLNATTGDWGIVQAKNSTTSIQTAMFDLSVRGGAYIGWSATDAYIITPAPRYQIILDPPPNTTGHIVTVNHYANPYPVYSDYGSYPFATDYEEALVKYAAWLYRYRDQKPNIGDPLYVFYEKQMRKAKNTQRRATGVKGFRVSFMK